MAKKVAGLARLGCTSIIVVGVTTIVLVALVASIHKKAKQIPNLKRTTFADEHFCGDSGVCTL
jgi:hypothetical protein